MAMNWSLDTPAQEAGHIAGMPLAELLDPGSREVGEVTVTLPVKANPYDLAPLRAQLAPYEAELEKMKAQAEALKVVDDATAEEATILGVRCQKIEKAVEEARQYYKAPALAFGKEIDSFAAAYRDKAQAAKRTLSGKVGQYTRKKEEEARELLRRQQEEARKLQEKADSEAKALGTDAPAVVVPKDMPPVNTIRTTVGKAITKKKWVCLVEEPAIVPREYCEVSQPLLNKAVAAGIREIPGCKIFEEANASFGA